MKTQKRTLIALLAVLIGFSLPSLAQNEDSDTTKFTIKGLKVIVIDDDSTDVEFDIGDDDEDVDEISHFKGLYLGVAGLRNPQNSLNLGPSQIELNYARSFNWQINLFEKSVPIVKEYVKLSTGVGLNLSSYQIANNLNLVKGPNDVLELPDPTKNFDKNKLRVGYITVPLLIGFSTTQDQEKGLKIAAGIQGGYRIQGNIKQKYEQNGETFKPKYRSDLYLNDFTYSAIARIGIDKIVLYAEYGLQPLFESGRAREMYPFSIGIRLVDFN